MSTRKSFGVRMVCGLVAAATLVASHGTTLVAATATATLTVTATVPTECTVTGGTLAFGTYSALSASNVDQTATISVACTNGTSATIGLDLGANPSGSTRRLSNGASGFLSYELYSNSGRTTVWGDSGGALVNYSASSNATQPFTVYGRVPGSQNVAAGSYNDSVTITVTF